MLNYIFCYLGNLKNDNTGQGLVEYGLVVSLIAIVAIIAITLFGNTVNSNFNDIVVELNDV